MGILDRSTTEGEAFRLARLGNLLAEQTGRGSTLPKYNLIHEQGSASTDVVRALFSYGTFRVWPVVEPTPMDVEIEYMESFDDELQSLDTEVAQAVEGTIDQLALGISLGRSLADLGLRQPRQILLWEDETESSLYTASITKDLVAIVTVDHDPANEQMVLGLISLASVTHEEDAYVATAAKLFDAYGIPYEVA